MVVPKFGLKIIKILSVIDIPSRYVLLVLCIVFKIEEIINPDFFFIAVILFQQELPYIVFQPQALELCARVSRTCT